MSAFPEGWVTYPAEELVAALRRLGFTIYPPGSAVPALVEAAREFARVERVKPEPPRQELWHAGTMLDAAARKVAGEGER